MPKCDGWCGPKLAPIAALLLDHIAAKWLKKKTPLSRSLCYTEPAPGFHLSFTSTILSKILITSSCRWFMVAMVTAGHFALVLVGAREKPALAAPSSSMAVPSAPIAKPASAAMRRPPAGDSSSNCEPRRERFAETVRRIFEAEGLRFEHSGNCSAGSRRPRGRSATGTARSTRPAGPRGS